uniref:Uncharacterized protein n=1 Tax=Glossina pallidipes TaxID=7398 RepID=A0A1A9Z3L2_GLOPL
MQRHLRNQQVTYGSDCLSNRDLHFHLIIDVDVEESYLKYKADASKRTRLTNTNTRKDFAINASHPRHRPPFVDDESIKINWFLSEISAHHPNFDIFRHLENVMAIGINESPMT